MEINRQNYETCFLLYIDQELSPADRAAVEIFLEENPDLRIEMEMLQGIQLPAELFSLPGKEGLKKPESITDTDWESLVLMLDGESRPEEQQHLQQRLQQEASLQKAWQELNAVKLNPAEEVACPHKAALYKKSAGRLVSLRLMRTLAAAAVLLFGLWISLPVFNKDTTPTPNTEITATNKGNSSSPASEKLQPAASALNPVNNTVTEPVMMDDPRTEKLNMAAVPSGHIEKSKALTSARAAAQKEKTGKDPVSENINTIVRNETNPLPVTYQEAEQKEVAVSPAMVANIAGKNTKPLSALDTDIMQAHPEKDIRTASYQPTEEPDQNHVLFLSDDQVKKTKLNTVVRKLKRTVERNTQIQVGNRIRIAGFEIAVR